MVTNSSSGWARTIYITMIDSDLNRHLIPVILTYNFTLFDFFRKLNANLFCNCIKMRGSACHFEVVNGMEKLPLPGCLETDIIQNLYHQSFFSRIACQILLTEYMNGLVIKVPWKVLLRRACCSSRISSSPVSFVRYDCRIIIISLYNNSITN